MSFAQRRVQDLSALVEATTGNASLGVLTLQNIGSLSSQHGLAVGGAAQTEFSERISGMLRPCDQMLALSEDRICIVFDELLDDNHVLLAALKVERAFAEPLIFEGSSLHLDVRAGFVYFGKQERLNNLQPEDIYRFAETAREHAVERNAVFEISSEQVFSQMQRDWEMNQSLDNALKQHELSLDYQPKYRFSDGELVGAEAIVRWRRGGEILPADQFMPTLNNARLWDLTLYCMRRVFREMVDFPVEIPIALNVYPAVLEHPSFLSTLQSELKIWDISPQRLALEISESRFDSDKTFELLNTIRSLGISIAIDEFGTGQASLERFRNLPVDELKIDRAFINNIVSSEDDQRITETIIELAHRFDKTVSADGVDDAETFTYLMNAGCDLGQGFYLSAPLNESQLSQLITAVA